MNRKKITEFDIVDSLLADASNDVKARVAETVHADPETAEIHGQWRSILHAVESEAEASKAVRQRLIDRAMQRIRLEELRPDTAASRKLDWGAVTAVFENIRYASWRKLGVASAVAVLAVTCAGFLLQWAPSPGFDVGAMQAHNGVEANEAAGANRMYVDFQFHGLELGTESQPFQTLASSIDHANAGEILMIKSGSTRESVRIAKPMTLVAVGGQVRIGS